MCYESSYADFLRTRGSHSRQNRRGACAPRPQRGRDCRTFPGLAPSRIAPPAGVAQGALVRSRGEAQRRVYSLNPAGLDEVDRWVAQCREMWNRRLDALDVYLQQMVAQEA